MTASGNREKALSLLKVSNITHAPIDLDKIATYLDFIIIPYDFPDKRKGMLFMEGAIKAVGVNKNHIISLQRYTVGHEFGHFVNGHKHEDNLFIEDETRYYTHHFQNEREADLFAAELLMPKNFLEEDLSIHGLDIEELIKKYQVSEKAMWIRLKTLRLAEKYSS
jgi:Zn-dependent peptidase ImmA (M78 family)